MSIDSARVMVAIAKMGKPATTAMLREKLPDITLATLYSAIGNHFKGGRLIRTGECGCYAYSLSESLQAFVKANGADAVVRGYTIRRIYEPVASALQPTWPAMQCGAPLRPAVRAALPWEDEEAVPPWLSERLRDALCLLPMDD